MISKRQYEIWRRFIPYTVWSRRIIDYWNEAVRIKSRIRVAPVERARRLEAEFRDEVERIKTDLLTMCDAIRRTDWSAIPIDILEIPRAESRVWLDYYVAEEIDFEVLCANIDSILDDAIDELEAKIPVLNKIVALHKRWFYKSPRGRGHNISIEGIATIIIPAEEKKEDYESELKEALEKELLGTPGFDRLEAALSQELLGFEESMTKEEPRGIIVEEVKWWHKIVERQLTIREYLWH